MSAGFVVSESSQPNPLDPSPARANTLRTCALAAGAALFEGLAFLGHSQAAFIAPAADSQP